MAARESLNFPSTGYDKPSKRSQLFPCRVGLTGRQLAVNARFGIGCCCLPVAAAAVSAPIKLLIWSLRLRADRVILDLLLYT